MSAQDPELSAALGWPGGISDPVLDRKVLLQMVAALRLASRQALEAICGAKLCEVNSMSSRHEMVRLMDEAITALRAVLAQQDEPAREWVSMDEYKRLQGLVTSQGIRLMEYESKQPQQAEPVEPVAWDVTKDGRLIYDYDFTHDAVLRVMGDFENDEQRVRYAKQIVDKLNAAPAQQAVAAAELRRQHGEIKSMRAERLRSERRLLDVKAQRDALLEALKTYGWHTEDCPQYPTHARPKNWPACTCGFDAAIKAVEEGK